jgi:hypothetical protein
MKIKTISEYLLIDIDEPHRKAIVKNVIEQNLQNLITTEKVESRSQALLKAFVWNKSFEGFEHWHELFIYFVEIDGAKAADLEFFNKRIDMHRKNKKKNE